MVDGHQDVRFSPAAAFGLDFLADLYTRTFADYFFPCLVTPEDLAGYVRIEQLDLGRCPVMLVAEAPVGFATVGIRGEESYCKGFGVTVPFRGKGLSHVLCEEMVRLAREAGAQRMSLGVIKNNTRAVSTYQRADFEPLRELVSLEWQAGSPDSASPENSPDPVAMANPAELLDHFDDLHAVRPVWDRDLPSLKEIENLRGVAALSEGIPTAYILSHAGPDATAIVDMGARPGDASSHQSLHTLLAEVQQQSPTIVCYNEPSDNPLLEVLLAAGFRETVRRYELVRVL